MNIFNSKLFLALSGVIVGLLAISLALFGNPANMAICVACFIRDTAGALKLHSAETVQYARPEIMGFVLGSFIISLLTKEFKATAGSSPLVRFVLGFIIMIGALIFLGCPLRLIIRMSSGDLNAYVGLVGFVLGIFTGSFFLKKGFSLGRAYEVNSSNGYILPAIMVIILILSLFTSLLAVSQKGPGSAHAPILVSLLVAIIFGAIAQKNRICFAGSFRDIILIKNFNLISIIGGLFVTLLVYNLATSNFNLSFSNQPIAHAQHLWNFLGLYAVGFAAVLAGGCPLRQLILAGQGSTDSAITFLGMLIGAAFAHNFGLASSAASADSLGGPSLNGKITLVLSILILFVIAIVNCKKRKLGGSK